MDPFEFSKPSFPLLPPRIPASLVVLDVPGVLYDHTIWRRWLFQLLKRVGLTAEFDVFWQLWDEQFEAQSLGGDAQYWDTLRCYLREVGMRAACIDEVLAAGQARRHQMETPLRPLDGTGRALSLLFQKGLTLIATGHRSDSRRVLPALIDSWGLRQYFAHVDQDSPAVNQETTARWQALTSPELDCDVAFVSCRPKRLRQADRSQCITIGIGCAWTRTLEDLEQLSNAVQCEHHERQRRAA